MISKELLTENIEYLSTARIVTLINLKKLDKWWTKEVADLKMI